MFVSSEDLFAITWETDFTCTPFVTKRHGEQSSGRTTDVATQHVTVPGCATTVDQTTHVFKKGRLN